MTDSELHSNPRHRVNRGSLSADEFAGANPRRGFNNYNGYLMGPNAQNQGAYQQYAGQQMWAQQGMMNPPTPTGNYQQYYANWAQQPQYQLPAGGYGQQTQQMPAGVPMQTGRRVSRPVIDDSQSESSYTSGLRTNQL